MVVGPTTEGAEQMMRSGVSVGGQLPHGVSLRGVNGVSLRGVSLMMVEGRSWMDGMTFSRLPRTSGFDCISSKNTFRRDFHSGDFQFHSHAMHFCKRVTCVSLFSCHGRMKQRHGTITCINTRQVQHSPRSQMLLGKRNMRMIVIGRSAVIMVSCELGFMCS